MDPDQTLAQIRRIIADMARPRSALDELVDARLLAELVEALDDWITKGGFLPQPWRQEPF
jgi:hypothetical protein